MKLWPFVVCIMLILAAIVPDVGIVICAMIPVIQIALTPTFKPVRAVRGGMPATTQTNASEMPTAKGA